MTFIWKETLSGKEKTIFVLKREQDEIASAALLQTGPNLELWLW